MMYDYQDALAYSGVEEAHPGGHSLTKKILKNERINLGSTVLDAGCGTGLTSAYLARKLKCKVYAIDKHQQMIKIATTRIKKDKLPVKIINGNIEKLPFPDDCFDYVIAESSTIFTDISKTLKEYHRVLKPSGVVIDIEMISKESLQREDKTSLQQFYNIKKFPSEVEWGQAFKKAGFKKIDILQVNSILQELEDYNGKLSELNERKELQRTDPQIEEILFEHSRMMMNLAEKLGYSVFRAVKM
ncbi:class I SAM-dependent methyltransferase [Robertmurraya massiliosenegalensis]|uniref:class I SAM-dependent methyltransferase n=1 Tax=Robertmurraya massiliosenegalensis TaxID=1287657 RepID=UPI0002F5E34B|nr:class I SAM-dependent methyltransferase [Robertmurraya massiliosenegalensis]